MGLIIEAPAWSRKLVPAYDAILEWATETPLTKDRRIVNVDIREADLKQVDRLVDYLIDGCGLWFSCQSVYGTGFAFPGAMDAVAAPAKRDTVIVHASKKADAQTKIEIPEVRQHQDKPPILLTSFDFLQTTVDLAWLAKKLNLKDETEAVKFLEKLYSGVLTHMVLPIKEEYRDLFPFTKETEDGLLTAAFMCTGAYEPMKILVEKYEAEAKKIHQNLCWPFMASSLTHNVMPPVVTGDQAYDYLERLDPAASQMIVIYRDSLMDQIVRDEWGGRGGSQSLIDLVKGGPGEIYIRRRGTVAPEVIKDFLRREGYVIEWKKDKELIDLYPDESPPITNLAQMENLRERLKVS